MRMRMTSLSDKRKGRSKRHSPVGEAPPLANRPVVQQAGGGTGKRRGSLHHSLDAVTIGTLAPHAEPLPGALRMRYERRAGLTLDDVRLYRNSAHPAAIGARAFAAGDAIHLAPGEDRHLAHEAWHVVQQRQGRVAATGCAGGLALNDSDALEREASQAEHLHASIPVAAIAGEAGRGPVLAPPNSPPEQLVQRMMDGDSDEEEEERKGEREEEEEDLGTDVPDEDQVSWAHMEQGGRQQHRADVPSHPRLSGFSTSSPPMGTTMPYDRNEPEIGREQDDEDDDDLMEALRASIMDQHGGSRRHADEGRFDGSEMDTGARGKEEEEEPSPHSQPTTEPPADTTSSSSSSSSSGAPPPVRLTGNDLFAPTGSALRVPDADDLAGLATPTPKRAVNTAMSSSSTLAPRLQTTATLPSMTTKPRALPPQSRVGAHGLQPRSISKAAWMALSSNVMVEGRLSGGRVLKGIPRQARPVQPDEHSTVGSDVPRIGFEFEGVGTTSLSYKFAEGQKVLPETESDRSSLAAADAARQPKPVFASPEQISLRNEQQKRMPIHATDDFYEDMAAASLAKRPVERGVSVHPELAPLSGGRNVPLELVTAAHRQEVGALTNSVKATRKLLGSVKDPKDGKKAQENTIYVNARHPLALGETPARPPGPMHAFNEHGDMIDETADTTFVNGGYGLTSQPTLKQKLGNPQVTMGLPLSALTNPKLVDLATGPRDNRKQNLQQALAVADELTMAHLPQGAGPEQIEGLRYLMMQSAMNRIGKVVTANRRSGLVKDVFGVNPKGPSTASAGGFADDDHLFEIRRRATAMLYPKDEADWQGVRKWRENASIPDTESGHKRAHLLLSTLAQVGMPGLSAQAEHEGGREIPNFRNQATGKLSFVAEMRDSSSQVVKAAQDLYDLKKSDPETKMAAEDMLKVVRQIASAQGREGASASRPRGTIAPQQGQSGRQGRRSPPRPERLPSRIQVGTASGSSTSRSRLPPNPGGLQPLARTRAVPISGDALLSQPPQPTTSATLPTPRSLQRRPLAGRSQQQPASSSTNATSNSVPVRLVQPPQVRGRLVTRTEQQSTAPATAARPRSKDPKKKK